MAIHPILWNHKFMQISTHGVMTIPQELGNLPSFDHGIYDDNYWLQLVNKPIRETHTI